MSIEVPILILLIAIPFYFLINKTLKSFKIGTDKNRWLITFISTLIISPIIYIAAILIWIFTISYYPNNDFNRDKWVSNKEERFKMSKDIIESEILIGKTKSEIIQLLGEDYFRYDENHIAYDLGFVPGIMNIDPYVLDIYFEKGKVIKVDQHET